jgi:hypothetical protein
MIDQIGIALTGVTAIFLTQSKSPKLQRYACLFGMAGQPFWIWSAWHAGQWGVLALTALYTAAWAKGVWTHWVRPKTAVPNPVAAFAYTENHRGRGKLVIGFDSIDELHRAHEIASRQFCRRELQRGRQ